MPAVDDVRRVLEGLPDLRLAYVFGSVATGRDSASSDLDVAVLFADRIDSGRLDRLSERLSAAAGRPVDLVDLSKAPPLLAHQVVARGTCLVSRDRSTQASFETRTVMRFLDTRHLRSIQHRYLGERARAHHDRRA
ncbi:MAG: nucleotidyltransferase domain-containing protein [bacterium]|nr:nucleotidyltransferase domain-containing protein [bacterium]